MLLVAPRPSIPADAGPATWTGRQLALLRVEAGTGTHDVPVGCNYVFDRAAGASLDDAIAGATARLSVEPAAGALAVLLAGDGSRWVTELTDHGNPARPALSGRVLAIDGSSPVNPSLEAVVQRSGVLRP
ncbi:MAG: hypothetical protein JWM98_926 [Thermoleophilia bacterium]|nr:hypothetical protein [Thermoleophilia bacterium]